MMLRRTMRWVPILLLSAAVACDDDDDPVAPTGSVSVSLAPATLTVPAGQTATAETSVEREGTFDGTVELEVEGAPTGITWDFAPSTIESDATTTMLLLTVDAATPAGTYTLTIRAQGEDVSDATTTVSVTVSPATTSSLFTSTATQLALAR